jgi:hypothetical protein
MAGRGDVAEPDPVVVADELSVMALFDELLSGVYSSTVADISVLVREVRLRIGVLSRTVTIRIYHNGKRPEPYSFELSHTMKTGADPEAIEGSRDAPSENEALRRAVRCLTEHYEKAVRRGEIPDEGWLVLSDVSR